MIHRQKLVSVLTAVSIITLWIFFSSNKLSYSTPNDLVPTTDTSRDEGVRSPDLQSKETQPKFDSIMPSMPDQKAKEELGRASWKYFHTCLLYTSRCV